MRNRLFKKYSKFLSKILTDHQIKKMFDRLERVSSKIAPLSSSTGNTQTLNRWNLNQNDPHYASEAECKDIFIALLEDLLTFLKLSKQKPRLLLSYFSDTEINSNDLIRILNTNTRIGNLELPIWYKVTLDAGGKHQKDNIFWFSAYKELEEMRKLAADKMIITKIQVKSYLTDRRQTGDYQTNREVRWETHPKSPQFASKIDCMLIEAKLLAQIFLFVGAPNLKENEISTVEKVLAGKFKKDGFKCPISGKPIFYNEFHEKISNPTHGRSGFQVGHLSPLASTGKHIASNTSWITDLGNRVQGESSLEEITNDVFLMADFHKERLNLSWSQVEAIAKKKES